MKRFTGIGSWTSGSCKVEDILPAALDCLQSIDGKIAEPFQREYDEFPDEYDDEAGADLLSQVEDAINANLPPYLYWGAAEGDGADFGVWVSFESIDDDRRSGELPSCDELPETADGQFLHVSDHGNMELYAADNGRWVSVWGVV